MKKVVLLAFVLVLLSTAVVVRFVRPVADSLPVHNIDSGKVIAQTNSTTTVYLDPPTINGTAIGVGNTVTANINIADAVDIHAWQAGLIFNATLLECTDFEEGEFLSNVGDTTWSPGMINNTAGLITFYGCALVTALNASGSGRLAYLTFKVKGEGVSDLHLRDVIVAKAVWDEEFQHYVAVMVPVNIIDVYTVVLDGIPYNVVTVSNSTGYDVGEPQWIDSVPFYPLYHSGFYDHAFIPSYGISFNVTGPYPGFSNVTIPETLMSGAQSGWTVILDGTPLSTENRTVTYNGTHYSVYFTYSEDVHTIQITSPYVVPEFPTWTSMLLILIVLTVSTAIYKRRPLKTPTH